MTFWHVCLVGIGGFFGAISRFYVGQIIENRFSSAFPYGTLTINLIGSFVLGLLTGLLQGSYMTLYLLIGTGFMGAFTTFSTMKLESLLLVRNKRWTSFVIYLGVSYALGITLAFVGYIAGAAVI